MTLFRENALEILVEFRDGRSCALLAGQRFMYSWLRSRETPPAKRCVNRVVGRLTADTAMLKVRDFAGSCNLSER